MPAEGRPRTPSATEIAAGNEAAARAKEVSDTPREDDIYSMVTEGMEDTSAASTGEVKDAETLAMERAERLIARDKNMADVGAGAEDKGQQEKIVDYTELSEHKPGLPGQDDLAAQEEALGGTGAPTTRDPAERYGNLPPFQRPSERASTPEEQERRKADLVGLREKLVRVEQDDMAKFTGGESGAYYEKRQQAIEAYDKARAEFIAGDIGRYSQEQFELMKKRGEGTPGKFEKTIANADKFLRRHHILKFGISGALLGAGLFFPTALAVRQTLAGGGAFVGSYELMRRASLNGIPVLIQGIKKESLKNLQNLGAEELEKRMAALAAYAKVQGYWDDVEGPYKKLQEAHLVQIQKDGKIDVNKYASEQITKSREAFDERLWKEDLKKQARVAGAIGIGAATGGLFKWLFGTPKVPTGPGAAATVAGDGGEHYGTPLPEGINKVPQPRVIPRVDDYTPPSGGGTVGELEQVDVPQSSVPMPDGAPENLPYGHDYVDNGPPPDSTIQEALKNVVDYIPASHGLRPEYYDLIKDKSAADFLGRKMFSTSLDTQYPVPKYDSEYPWINQQAARIPGISDIRMKAYMRLQDRMGAALGKLSDPDALDAAKKLSVSEFLKQIMGTAQSVGSATTVLH